MTEPDAAQSSVIETLEKMLEKRRNWLASCERTIELLQPEWDRFQARTAPAHDPYVSRLYAEHVSNARLHRKEIAALEACLAVRQYLEEQK